MAQCQVGHPPTWTCSACPGLATEPVVRAPAPAHFNARGELIHYTVVSPDIAIASVPSEDPATKDAPGSPDTDLDLELAYPDDEPTDPASPPAPPPEFSAPYTSPTPSHSQFPPAPRPLPRRAPRPAKKATAPPPIAVPSVPYVYGVPQPRPAPIMPPRVMSMPMPLPIPVRPMPAPVPAVAAPPQILCTTAGCGGVAPGTGRRCFACVRGSWAGLREEKEKAEAEAEDKPKRVTIKLKVTPKGSPARDKKGKGKAVEEPTAPPTPPKDGPDGADNAGVWDGVGWDSDLSALTDSDSESKVEEPPRPSLKIRIPARTPNGSPTKPTAQFSPASASAVASASLPTPPSSTAGTPEAPRLCTIARCRVPLPPLSLYRWKCCSACRKQYREYQRGRLARLAGSNPSNAATATATTSEAAPQPPQPPRPSPLPPHIEALRVEAARNLKECQRLENQLALEAAGVPIPPPPLRARESGTWSLAPGAQDRKAEAGPRRVEGARVCKGRGCGHIIPPEAEYLGKICAVCRGRERRKAARNPGKEVQDTAKEKEADKEMEDLPLAPVKQPGRCIYADCGMLMPVAASDVSECEQCLRRKTQRRVGRPPGSRNKPKALPASVTQATDKPVFSRHPQAPATAPAKPAEAPRKRKRVSPYPAYQCRDALLQDFGGRFHSFIQAQSYYFLMRGSGMNPATAPQPPAQAMFDFSGEYSVVAGDLDVVSRKAEVELGVHVVKDLVARAGGLEFSPTSWVSILGNPGGVVTRFACVHLVNVFLPIRVPPGHPPNPARPKSMQGELEIAVLPDDSHKHFPGEKTIVRFRLVG